MFVGVALALHLFKAHVLILTSAYKIKTLALKRLILKRHIAKKTTTTTNCDLKSHSILRDKVLQIQM